MPIIAPLRAVSVAGCGIATALKHHRPACRRRRRIEHFGVGYAPLGLPGLMQDRPGTMALQHTSSSALQTMHALAYDGPAFHLRILIKRRLRCVCSPALALALPNLLHQDRRLTFRPHPWTSLRTTTSASRTFSRLVLRNRNSIMPFSREELPAIARAAPSSTPRHRLPGAVTQSTHRQREGALRCYPFARNCGLVFILHALRVGALPGRATRRRDCPKRIAALFAPKTNPTSLFSPPGHPMPEVAPK